MTNKCFQYSRDEGKIENRKKNKVNNFGEKKHTKKVS